MCSIGRIRKAASWGFVCIAWALASAQVLAAPVVTFVAHDLPDTTLGQDLWRYTYTVRGVTLPFSTIAIHFGYPSYSDIALGDYSSGLTPSPPEIQPDPVLGDGLVIVGWESAGLLSSGNDAFSVDFVWHAATLIPGTQVADYEDDNGFESFLTIASQVPEPGAGVLMSSALAAFVLARRRLRVSAAHA